MNIPAPLIQLLAVLPETPPTFATVALLNLLRKPLWPEEDFAWWEGRQVRMAVSDLNWGITLSYQNGRFVCGDTPADVTLTASLADYWLIARRQEDPDTLFFQRRLTILGDTELGLTLKNLMDATDFSPLFARLPSSVRMKLNV
ncbi:ubiquinone anaerobic biosynthesis accessory factor UbiT [Deefgea salmonis]|uniref:Ubiquinone biosynthesis accessory factor UbiT n=1 Tax=Deefgea salmonis TaxID=2875502 RepID=A0ABS8BNA5_9NEIS|nr:SCP2 sterol-binding domain-containing protein [Deefgea salmonis]MCB5197026.1 SCP2 sterol-binding domain-containing protein [Deefgea salmonis]